MKTIEIGFDTEDAAEFAEWLCQRGHGAFVGTSTGTFVDGIHTATDEAANELIQDLWSAFCAQDRD